MSSTDRELRLGIHRKIRSVSVIGTTEALKREQHHEPRFQGKKNAQKSFLS